MFTNWCKQAEGRTKEDGQLLQSDKWPDNRVYAGVNYSNILQLKAEFLMLSVTLISRIRILTGQIRRTEFFQGHQNPETNTSCCAFTIHLIRDVMIDVRVDSERVSEL